MNLRYVEESLQSSADPRAVWALLADLESYTRWGIWDDVGVQSGVEHARVGSIRRMRSGFFVVKERITRVVPEQVIEYQLLSGMPVKNYVAATRIESTPGGCCVIWSSQFTPLLPGTGSFLCRRFSRLFKDLLVRLTSAAEQVTVT